MALYTKPNQLGDKPTETQQMPDQAMQCFRIHVLTGIRFMMHILIMINLRIIVLIFFLIGINLRIFFDIFLILFLMGINLRIILGKKNVLPSGCGCNFLIIFVQSLCIPCSLTPPWVVVPWSPLDRQR